MATMSLDSVEDYQNCKHYARKCSLVSPCCDKVYACRFCHDEHEDHKLIRTNVEQIECRQCGLRQKVSSNCEKCLISFGKYYCGKCRMFDDNDKGQFHCDGCGICRVGGRDNFIHCDTCGFCLSKSIYDSHKCLEKVSRNSCAICLEDLHTSTIPAHVPKCGHLLHSTCFHDLLRSGGYTCPTCNESLIDMSSTWRRLDSTIALTPMPPEYANIDVRILCRDCHKHSTTKFHIVALKCGECGSYNTCRDDADNVNGDVVAEEDNVEHENIIIDDDDGPESSDDDDIIDDVTDNDSSSSDLSLD
ncbi:RING finger and CHY zinc finger domain-containing protein 1-like [Xenia sp. Carnegie-2017]|uniref:RING finger and CHY zinc finger domain-containing protein 1-like n=1 Tax=Xenia sp. Carnegie-2017 TaxID=2897299 RepID=UPI001F036BBE|nr:RING finger and CHY zinc finger domain-containing protein 1-like [Xenia sp. Carnegie-2017]XP_046849606.1 RING finger and CHY zinc finger domain-containing protein 1-like [Xenia sp. Carnegie-2017]XP_046849611.1 RING finger and CHY zinc finger domain-containing protein 1-like [Xenia sp. Carnegie-2017]